MGFVAGSGAKVKRDWAKPRISPFRRQFCSSITRHWHEFLALQYQGAMRPHACASWLKCRSYAAPVEPAKGGRVGDRVRYVALINRHLVIARLLHSPMAPVSSSFPKIAAGVQYSCSYRNTKSASVCKPRWLQLLTQGSPAKISGHPTYVAPGRQRTTIKPHRSKRRRPRPTTSKTKMTKAVVSSCVRDSAHVA